MAKACRDFGQRVQYSVFEIEVDPAQWTKLKARLEGIIAPEFDRQRVTRGCRSDGRDAPLLECRDQVAEDRVLGTFPLRSPTAPECPTDSLQRLLPLHVLRPALRPMKGITV